MAVRMINYTVSASGISPNTIQRGGIQGEHKATRLLFTIDTALYADLMAISGVTVKYRFDVYNGVGGKVQGESNTLTTATLNFDMEDWLTRYGGTIQIYLVITAISGTQSTEMELYSFPAFVRLTDLPDGTSVDPQSYESLTTITEQAIAAKNEAQAAQTAAESAQTAAEDAKLQTEQAKLALESGNTFVFDGGKADTEIDINFFVDTQMSDISSNPIANKTVKTYVDGKTQVDSEMSDVSENAVQNKVIKAAIDTVNTVLDSKAQQSAVDTLTETANATAEKVVYHVLWSGTASADAVITVAGIGDYQAVIATAGGMEGILFLTATGSGYTGMVAQQNQITTLRLNISSGNNITVQGLQARNFNADGSLSGVSALQLTKIRGYIKKTQFVS